MLRVVTVSARTLLIRFGRLFTPTQQAFDSLDVEGLPVVMTLGVAGLEYLDSEARH